MIYAGIKRVIGIHDGYLTERTYRYIWAPSEESFQVLYQLSPRLTHPQSYQILQFKSLFYSSVSQSTTNIAKSQSSS